MEDIKIDNKRLNIKYKLCKIKNKYQIEDNFYLINLEKPLENIYQIEDDNILKYLEIITAVIPREYLDNMYRNLRSIKIINKFSNKTNISNKIKIYLNKMFLLGEYNPYYNKISYVSKENYDFIDGYFLGDYQKIMSEVIPHELFHLCSSKNSYSVYAMGYSDDIKDHVGFSQFTKNQNIGNALNEGYTELLTQRYFNKKYSAYDFETKISSFVEEILGRDILYNIYFNANLADLFRLLSTLSTQEETYEFITNLDDILNYKSEINIVKKDIIIDKLDNIIKYLIKIYINKLNYAKLCKEIKASKIIKFKERLIKVAVEEYLNLKGKNIDVSIKIKKK